MSSDVTAAQLAAGVQALADGVAALSPKPAPARKLRPAGWNAEIARKRAQVRLKKLAVRCFRRGLIKRGEAYEAAARAA